MSMFQRTFEADPPVYVVSFKLHYKVKPGDAVYLAIDGRNQRMTYGQDHHGDIWTFVKTFCPSWHQSMSHSVNYKYHYFVAKFGYAKNVTNTVCFENSEEVMERQVYLFWGNKLYVDDWCHHRHKNTVWNEFGQIVN